MKYLLDHHVERDADVTLATTWSQPFVDRLARRAAGGAFALPELTGADRALNRSLVPEVAYQGLMASLYGQQQRAGLSTTLLLAHHRPACRVTIRRYDHHFTHAAYAGWSAPFRDAAILVVNGMGESGAAAIFAMRDRAITPICRHVGRE